MKAFKCPNCGGDVRYDINQAEMCCEHCGGMIPRKRYQEYLDQHSRYLTNQLICPQCGSAMLSYDDTIATFCAYCGSSVSFTRRIVEDVKPDGIIPFSVSGPRALQCYRSRTKYALFAPDWVREDGEKKLVGIYMPYYAFSASASEHIKTEGTRRSDEDYFTKEEYKLEFDLKGEYVGFRFDASKAFPDYLSRSIDTFEEKPENGDPEEGLRSRPPAGLVPFESSYLAGFYADGQSVDERVYDDAVREAVREDLFSEDLDIEDFSLDSGVRNPRVSTRAKKYLFPVWLITHRWGDRVSYAAVNGQNGDTAAELPVDKWKYLFVTLIAAALLSLVLNLLWTLKPMTFLLIAGGLLLLMCIRLGLLSRDVYLREHHADDAGRTGKDLLKSAGVLVPFSVFFKSCWKVLAGMGLIAAVLLVQPVHDEWYYAAGALGLALSVWSSVNLLQQRNLLMSRDIPVFSRKRGGDPDAK